MPFALGLRIVSAPQRHHVNDLHIDDLGSSCHQRTHQLRRSAATRLNPNPVTGPHCFQRLRRSHAPRLVHLTPTHGHLPPLLHPNMPQKQAARTLHMPPSKPEICCALPKAPAVVTVTCPLLIYLRQSCSIALKNGAPVLAPVTNYSLR